MHADGDEPAIESNIGKRDLAPSRQLSALAGGKRKCAGRKWEQDCGNRRKGGASIYAANIMGKESIFNRSPGQAEIRRAFGFQEPLLPFARGANSLPLQILSRERALLFHYFAKSQVKGPWTSKRQPSQIAPGPPARNIPV